MLAPISKWRLSRGHSIQNDGGQVVGNNGLNAITTSKTLVANVVVLPMIVGGNGAGSLAKYKTITPINKSGYRTTSSHSSVAGIVPARYKPIARKVSSDRSARNSAHSVTIEYGMARLDRYPPCQGVSGQNVRLQTNGTDSTLIQVPILTVQSSQSVLTLMTACSISSLVLALLSSSLAF